jgi:hypothetical protein
MLQRSVGWAATSRRGLHLREVDHWQAAATGHHGQLLRGDALAQHAVGLAEGGQQGLQLCSGHVVDGGKLVGSQYHVAAALEELARQRQHACRLGGAGTWVR